MAGNGGGRIEGGLRTRGVRGNPLVSVITVVYNGERHLEQTIQSVVNQRSDKVEYLIIDGGSTDGTLDIIRKYEDRIDYWVSEPDGGTYDAMNKGIDLARGELIGLLNADDYYEPDALGTVVGAYESGPCLGIYYGNNYVIQGDLALRYKSYPSLRHWLGMTICHQAMFVHRSVYGDVGKYSLGYRFAADYEFTLRAATRKVRYIHIDAFLVNYRNTGLTSFNYAASLREGKRINREYFGTFSVFHGKYLASYYKTLALYWAQKAIRGILGERILNRLRLWYMEKFIARESEKFVG